MRAHRADLRLPSPPLPGCQARVSLPHPRPLTGPASPSPLPPPSAHQRVYAPLSGAVHRRGFTLLYGLVCLAQPSEVGSPHVFLFFSFSLSPSFLHVTLLLPPFNTLCSPFTITQTQTVLGFSV